MAAPEWEAEGPGVPGEFLERLDAGGALVLPDKRQGRATGSVTRVPRTAAGEPGRPLLGSVRDVEPLRVELVREPAQRLLFRELVGRYHYLGHRVPFGAHLRYLVFASRPARAVVGCLQSAFSSFRTCGLHASAFADIGGDGWRSCIPGAPGWMSTRGA